MIYFDTAATSPPFPETVEAVASTMTRVVGNPASLHGAGLEAERVVRTSRDRLAATLGVGPNELVFTSGGTESINTALFGYLSAYPRLPKRIVTTRTEHPAVLRSYERLAERGYETILVDVDGRGRIRLDALEEALRRDTALLSLLHVNNETGAVQPMDEIAALLRRVRPDAALHLDCVQSFCKTPLALKRWGVRMASFSAHKFHGPKGIGLLYVAKGTRFEPLLVGGGQQGGLRSGTENPPLVAGMAVAAERMASLHGEYAAITKRIRDRLLAGFEGIERIRPVVLSPEDGLSGILNISFPGIRPETLINALSARGTFISSVSACSAKKMETSHVLLAMGVPPDIARSAVRISFSVTNREEEAETFLTDLDDSLALILPKR
jgi:cysteine desulfurase